MDTTTCPSSTPVTRTAPRRPPAAAPRLRRTRCVLATVAIAACLPYLVLKLLWLAGVPVGLADTGLAHDPVMRVANLGTLGLDVAAVLLAVALAGRGAWRLPAPLLQVPMLVATGLLGGIVVALPVQLVLSLTTPAAASTAAAEEPIRAWVFLVVYSGFGVLGLCLLTLFALHAWDRWVVPGGWTAGGAGDRPATALRASRAVLVLAVALAAAGVAETVALTARAGLEGVGALQVVGLVAALAAAGGLLRLARRPGARTLLATYAGAAVVAAWGLYAAVLLVVPNPLRGDGAVPPALVALEVARAVLGVAVVLVLPRLRPAARPTAVGATA